MGRLADLIGPRKVYLAGTLLVGLGGLIGYPANSLPTLVIARVVTGFGTSAAYPAAIAMVRRQSQRLRPRSRSRPWCPLWARGRADSGRRRWRARPA